MLQPDFSDRKAQQWVFRLRRRFALGKMGTFASVYDHTCEGEDEPSLVYFARGCARCGKTPILTLGMVCTTEFSQRDWQSWARALLASRLQRDRNFAFEILRGRYFGHDFKLLDDGQPRHTTIAYHDHNIPHRRYSFGRETTRNGRLRKRLNHRIAGPVRSVSCPRLETT
jgi:hypothetical protein